MYSYITPKMLAWFYRRLNFGFFVIDVQVEITVPNKVCFRHLTTVCYDKLEKQNLSF